MTYQIRDWNRNFENNKSREIDRCSFVCLPNKQHGMGFRRIMAELDGATIYGIWVCIVAACSQQEAPRLGWLTEDGRKNGAAWGASDIALKIGRPTNEIERCISVVSSPRIGWLAAIELPADCPPSADEVPADSPPTTLEGRKEENRRNGRKELMDLAELPEALRSPEFLTAWNNWQTFRIEIRHKLTPSTIQRQLKQLADVGPKQAIASIELSITKGWQGLTFPMNGRGPSATPAAPPLKVKRL